MRFRDHSDISNPEQTIYREALKKQQNPAALTRIAQNMSKELGKLVIHALVHYYIIIRYIGVQ